MLFNDTKHILSDAGCGKNGMRGAEVIIKGLGDDGV